MIKIAGALIVALVLAFGYMGWRAERADIRAERAQEAAERSSQQLADTTAALEAERAYTQRMHEIAAEHEEAKNEIERQAAADLADLRSGNLRLHDRWQACAATSRLPAVESAASLANDRADDRSASAVRAVRAAAECDATVKGLQAVVRADRAGAG